MSWEKRENGRRYFYLSERRPDGSVRRRYLGNGVRAEVEAIRIERGRAQREMLTQERQEAADLERLTSEAARSSTTLLDAHYFAAALHNPKGRGWRRRREMIKPVETAMEETVTKEAELPGKTCTTDLEQLVSLARRGDRDAARQLRAILHEEPDLFGPLGQLASKVQAKWIRAIAGRDLFEREMMLRATAELRKSLIEEGDGTELERLAVEQVISSFLQLNYHEHREAECPASDLRIAGHRAKQIEQASRRHMKALGALTTLRLLAPKIMPQQRHTALPDGHQDPQLLLELPQVNGNRLTKMFDRSLQPVPMN